MKTAITLMLGLLACASASASCYTILNAKGAVVFRDAQPPVDMSYRMHQVVPARFGAGAKMIVELSEKSCDRVLDTQRKEDHLSSDEVVQQLVDQRQPGALWGIGPGAQTVLDRQYGN